LITLIALAAGMAVSPPGTVLVFLKHPTPGAVKTRLAADVGPDRAAELYRGWIGTVFDQLQPVRGTARVVGYYAGGSRADFAPWHHLADDWRPQPDGDLGDRLAAGFAAAGGPAVAVGTDCLELDAELIRGAFAELADHDAVFGPAADGGYYLVGAARPIAGFFQGIRWSSEHTLADHLDVCRRNGWSAALLPVRHDLDTWADYQAYLRRRGG
jgi:rSAM/selenodomain-associated transferase 1